eukprot:CAMPEP_0185041672 /NCGR_PEP_ID=MMETSP1103-20130426/41285_1 /TAXON_ID=36769 /ORGANISM="Paraphysomonas bandaiensis, Strain Caron Lab Isolate" /LENGTH=52 /DNA_ID=CAMNT_0027581515 /DNA_START=654 /DNA_END=812 /DNA_ORIENTATION=+
MASTLPHATAKYSLLVVRAEKASPAAAAAALVKPNTRIPEVPKSRRWHHLNG